MHGALRSDARRAGLRGAKCWVLVLDTGFKLEGSTSTEVAAKLRLHAALGCYDLPKHRDCAQ